MNFTFWGHILKRTKVTFIAQFKALYFVEIAHDN